VDICPVGALTSTDFRFKMRVWFLKQTNSIDTESSVGANTVVWSREGIIYRITPRRNDEVNDTWLSDSARDLYKPVRAADRLTAIRVNGVDSTLDVAVKTAAEILKSSGALAVVGSGRSSVEEQFLTKRLAAVLNASTHIVTRVGEGDGILISADRNPNLRGALVTGLIAELPKEGRATTSSSAVSGDAAPFSIKPAGLERLGAAIDAGQVKVIASVGEDLLAGGLTAAQLAKVSVVYIGTHRNSTTAAAKIVIPTFTVFEKNGTFVNQQFRIQKFFKCVPGPAAAVDDLGVLTRLISALGGPAMPAEVNALWPVLAAEVRVLSGITFANLPETGLLLDATLFASMPFIEGETMHYKPMQATAGIVAGAKA
jgi:NADH-quinone oxidoreductase subunit G